MSRLVPLVLVIVAAGALWLATHRPDTTPAARVVPRGDVQVQPDR